MQKASIERTSHFENVPVLFAAGLPVNEDMAGKVTAVGLQGIYSEGHSDPFLSRVEEISLDEPHETGWKTYNFEVADHHTYVADGVRVHNTSTTYTVNPDGTLNTITLPDGQNVNVSGSWTPGQAYHYGQIVEVDNGDGTTRLELSSGNFFETLGTAARSFADLIGLDGRWGYQGTFAGHPPQFPGNFHENGMPPVYRVDWSGDQDAPGEEGHGIPDWRDEQYSNIGHWGGDRDGDGVPNWQDRNDGVGWRDNNPGGGGDTSGSGKPIILDLDGDGIEIQVDGNVSFDIDADGFKEQTSWVSPDDGFLVIDLNEDGTRGDGDGEINMTQEIAFTEWLPTGGVTDLQALSIFDQMTELGGNQDGVLSSADDVWDELRVWQDLNSNGEADDGELKTLSEWGITQINLAYDDGTAYDDNSNDVAVFGNTLLGSASYVHDGSVLDFETGTGAETVEGGVGDVALAHSGLGWRENPTDDGYEIEFESGETYRYVVLDGSGPANVDLTAAALDGAEGDTLANALDATDHTKSVQVSGGDDNDTITGGHMHDVLSGDAGVDVLNGGDGDDIVFFDLADLNIVNGVQTGVVNGGAGTDTAVFIGTENLTFDLIANEFEAIQGGDGADNLAVSFDGSEVGNPYSFTLDGGAGNDTLVGGEQSDTLSGGDNNDSLVGGEGGDVLLGGALHDTLDGGLGSDQLLGGENADYLDGGAADDVLLGGHGHDTLIGNHGDDTLSGGDHDDELDGGWGDDHLSGDAGNDVMNGGAGDDSLYGGDGADTLNGNGHDDYVDGGAGDDLLIDGGGDDTMVGGAGDDDFHVKTHEGNNVVQGGLGSDKLVLNGTRDMWNVKHVERQAVDEGGNLKFHDNGDPQMEGTGQYLVWSAHNFLHVQDVEEIEFTGIGNELHWSHIDWRTPQEWALAYLASNPDLVDALFSDVSQLGSVPVGSAKNHWDNYGEAAGRPVEFNALLYSASNPGSQMFNNFGTDIVKLTEHYIKHGHAAGRATDTFDPIQYLKNYQDLRDNFGTDLSAVTEHFINFGYGAGRTDQAIAGAMTEAEFQTWLDTGGASTTMTLAQADATEDNSATFYQADLNDYKTINDLIWSHISVSSVIDGGAGNDTILTAQNYNDDPNVVIVSDTVFGGDGADTIESGDSADSLEGGSGADSIKSNGGNDTINSQHGADSVDAGDGDDSVFGGGGDDTISGGSGADILRGNSGDDYLVGGTGNDNLKGHDGNDSIESGDGDDISNGGDGADIVTGDAGDDILMGEAGDDSLAGGEGADSLYGGDDDDLLRGEDGDDRLNGENGHDAIYGDAGADTLNGGYGKDLLKGGNDNDVISGDQDADQLDGGDGDDTLSGGLGHDILEGGAGADSIDGGDGLDTVIYQTATGSVTVRLDGTLTTTFTGDAVGDTLVSIENAFGSNFDDTITGSSVSNSLWGAVGNDLLAGGAGNDYLFGGVGNDTLQGDDGLDRLEGGDGDDSLDGGEGTDNLVGGFGHDTLVGGGGEDELFGNAGNDSLLGDNEDDTLDGGDGDDTLTGGNGNDSLVGGSGHDLLRGQSGDDRLEGGGGDDTFVGGTGADTFVGSDGSDLVNYGNSTIGVTIDLIDSTAGTGDATGDTFFGIEMVSGSQHDDNISGNNAHNTLTGLEGNDTLNGGSGKDTLNGGDGDDVLIGGIGADQLQGGNGIDTADYSDASGDLTINLEWSPGNLGAEAAGDVYFNVENVLSGSGNDTILGDGLDNKIWGGAGDDRLHGMEGDDTLIGQSGEDRFFFKPNWDNDVIDDFEDDIDTLVFQDFGFTDAADALSNATEVGADVIFDLGNGDTLTVKNATLIELQNDILV